MNQPTTDQTANKVNQNFPNSDRGNVAKTEYIDGKIVAKPASGRVHNLISANFAIAIGSRVQRSTCELYVNDMQVRIGKGSICFPDVIVVNGTPEFADAKEELLLNPTVAIEIFSGISKTINRTQRLEGYLGIPKIRECLLVNETEMRIEHYAGQNPKQWVYRIYDARDDVVSLDSINVKLSLAEVYAQVRFRQSELSSKAVN